MKPDDTVAAAASRFDPLVRDMQVFGLVEPVMIGEQRSWQLSPWVVERLETLAVPPPAPEKIIFIGHRCVRCGERRPTRSDGGTLVCDVCLSGRSAPETDPAEHREWAPRHGARRHFRRASGDMQVGTP